MPEIRTFDDALSRLRDRLACVLRNPSDEALHALVEERLSRAGRTDQERAKALSTTRPTLDRWRKAGSDLRLGVLAKLAQKSGEAIVIRFDPEPTDITKQATPPEWAERLEAKVDQLVIGAIVDPEQREVVRRLAGRLGVLPKPSVEGFDDLRDTEGPDTAAPTGQGSL